MCLFVYQCLAVPCADAEGSNTWIKTECGQGDADIPQKAIKKPSSGSGSEMLSGGQVLGQRDSELGQGDNVLGHGDRAANAPPLAEAVLLQTLIEPIKQQFTEELAQRDARIQKLEKTLERLGVGDEGEFLYEIVAKVLCLKEHLSKNVTL